jgi:hypothetical protein
LPLDQFGIFGEKKKAARETDFIGTFFYFPL